MCCHYPPSVSTVIFFLHILSTSAYAVPSSRDVKGWAATGWVAAGWATTRWAAAPQMHTLGAGLGGGGGEPHALTTKSAIARPSVGGFGGERGGVPPVPHTAAGWRTFSCGPSAVRGVAC